MEEQKSMKSEEEIAELVAEALTRQGLSAGAQDTGGGVCCVVIPRKDGGEIIWGTADVTWGAVVYDADGEVESSLATSCPSESQDIAAIAEAIKGPSLKAGATQ
jgi:hypothetical protein